MKITFIPSTVIIPLSVLSVHCISNNFIFRLKEQYPSLTCWYVQGDILL